MSALPPGPRMPRLAQTVAWSFRPGPFMLRARHRYGDAFTMRIGTEPPWVMLADPAAVRDVFTADPAALTAGEANLVLRPILGPASVLLLDGPRHMRERKLMLPAFHGSRMAGYEALVAAIAREHVATWPREVPLRLAPRMQEITLDVVLRAVFGVRQGAALAALRARVRHMMARVTSPAAMFAVLTAGPAWVERLRIFRPLLAPVDALLAEQIRARRAAPGEDVLSLLLEARTEDGRALSDRELRDELVTLLVAGHETTATALSWAVERLVRMPGGWGRLQAGGKEYAEAAAKEALRLRPVLSVVLRRLREPMTLGGLDLPRGTTVAPSIYLVHRRPDVYADPERFRPERFLPGARPEGGAYTWIPFGGGVRRCLGGAFALLEMRVVLAEVARAVDAAAVDPRSEGTRRRAVTMAPARGAEVVLS